MSMQQWLHINGLLSNLASLTLSSRRYEARTEAAAHRSEFQIFAPVKG